MYFIWISVFIVMEYWWKVKFIKVEVRLEKKILLKYIYELKLFEKRRENKDV